MPRLLEFKWVEQASKGISKEEIRKYQIYVNFEIREMVPTFKKLVHTCL